MAPTFEYITVEVLQPTIALVKYNNPKFGNSVHPQLVVELLSALVWVNSQDEIIVIVVSGEGKFFSTGMHLGDGNSTGMLSFAPGSPFHSLNRFFINCTKILVAAVNGPAAGYGVSSLALFDLVYAVPDAYFFTPFVKWGMAAEGSSSVSFPRLMGHQKAAQLFLAADRMTAEEAEKLGLISKILPKEGFLQAVIKIAKQIAQSPPGALKATKELMRQPVRVALLDANDRECHVLQNDRLAGGEPQKAIAEFKHEQQLKRKDRAKI